MNPCTLAEYEQEYRDRHLLHGVIARWAEVKPGAAALVNHDRDRTLNWAELESLTTTWQPDCCAWASGRATTWQPRCRS